MGLKCEGSAVESCSFLILVNCKSDNIIPIIEFKKQLKGHFCCFSFCILTLKNFLITLKHLKFEFESEKTGSKLF